MNVCIFRARRNAVDFYIAVKPGRDVPVLPFQIVEDWTFQGEVDIDGPDYWGILGVGASSSEIKSKIVREDMFVCPDNTVMTITSAPIPPS